MPKPTSNTASVILNWAKVGDIYKVSHYRVYVDNKLIANVISDNDNYTVENVSLYVEHSFRIEAVDYENNVKAKSNIIFITLPRINDLSINLNVNI